jgi:ABC-type branched-subunit amino acid transport system ATPase component
MTGGGLTVDDLQVRYGRATAVRNVTFQADQGSITAIVGPNGAGKSSTFLAVQGVVKASCSVMSIGDRSIVRMSAVTRARTGLVLVPEGRQIFPTLSVERNLQVVVDALGLPRRRIHAALERFPILSERRKQPAGVLSGGEQQMLALARALMSEPSVLLLDEPMQGLAPTIVASVWETLVEIRDAGATLVIASPTTRWLRDIDRGYVMLRGQIVAETVGTSSLEQAFLEQLSATPV